MKRMLLTLLCIAGMGYSSIVQGASSLSALGFGLPASSTSARSAGMGLTALAVPDTLGLNMHSPALWRGPKTTRYGFYGQYDRVNAEDASNIEVSDYASFRGVGMAISVAEGWFVGLAMSPYTRSNYEWNALLVDGLGEKRITQKGTGGFSQGVVGVSAPVRKDLRVGIAARTIFGKLDRLWQQKYTTVAANESLIKESERYNGFSASVSAAWSGPFGWNAGMYIDLPSSINTEQQKLIVGGFTTLVDTINTVDNSHETPLGFAFGVGKQFGRHLGAIEFGWQGWDAVDKPADISGSFANAFRFGAGWEYQPSYTFLDSYWKSATYRAGFYTQQHYIEGINGNQALTTALTAGMSMPYFGNLSRIDLGLQYGWRGNVDDDGVSERFLGIVIGFNHSQEWFVGRKERR